MANTALAQQLRVWRWHFWAGLMVLPLAIVLSISGAIYLFKPQYQQWYEQSLEQDLGSVADPAKTVVTIVSELQARLPLAEIRTVILPRHNGDRSLEVEVLQDNGLWLFWLDRYNGEVLASSLKSQMLMRWIKKLHGQLQLGNGGSYVVEFMAHWMIVLIISGLYLAVSRQLRASKGQWFLALRRMLLPRLGVSNSALFWRRLHAVTGVWFGLLILVFLVSGLPWTQVWGAGFKSVQKTVGWGGSGREWRTEVKAPEPHHVPEPLWQIRSKPPLAKPAARPKLESGFNLDQLIATITPLVLAAPVQIKLPATKQAHWTVRSIAADRSQRLSLKFDQTSGVEVERIEFGDHPPLQRLASYGIAFHEGALFGWLNQLVGVLAAVAVVLMAVSAAIMWWRRRPEGEWGQPVPSLLSLSWGQRLVVATLALLLPLFGSSLVTIIVVDWLLQRWWPGYGQVAEPV